MRIKRIRHICIIVKDIKKMSCFYKDVLGFKLISNQVYDSPQFNKGVGIDKAIVETCLLSLDDHLEIEMTKYITHTEELDNYSVYKIGYRHIALITEDIEEAYKEVKEQGLMYISEPVYIKRIDGKCLKFFYFKDPEGNIIELNEFV